jgi:hypothetical protein
MVDESSFFFCKGDLTLAFIWLLQNGVFGEMAAPVNGTWKQRIGV